MKKLLLSIILILFYTVTLFAQVTQEWVARYNGVGNGPDIPSKIKTDLIGNIYVTGKSTGNDSSYYDYCTIKYNSNGSQVWVMIYDGPGKGDDVATSMDIDNIGNVYVTGYSLGSNKKLDYCTIKYNSSGIQQWVARYNGDGNGDDKAFSMKVDNNGNVYVTGSSTSDDIYQTEQYLTIKYNTDGIVQWIKAYNESVVHPEIPKALVLDKNNNIIVTGSATNFETWEDFCTIKYSNSGVQLWVKQFSLPSVVSEDYANALCVDNSDNIYVTGYSENNAGKMCTIKYKPDGEQEWYSLYTTGIAVAQGLDIVAHNSDNVYVTGYSDAKIVTIKYNSSGTQQWVRRYEGPGIGSIAHSIALDLFENIYICGFVINNSGGLTDYLTMKYNSQGDSLWAIRFNGKRDSSDIAYSLCLDNAGNVIVTGKSKGINTNYDFATIKYSQQIGIQTISSEIPKSFSLSQNYPNPFNPTTKIRFSIPPYEGGKGDVTLTVFDLLGREITTLVNEQLKPGTYEVEWDASNYSSGMYFYKLTSESFSETKKLILLK
jgi:uncharacterized delta-60 repeat protein